jgi:dTDP-4-dehydrorhamnose reductase
MRILITGAGGMLGWSVVPVLSQYHEVSAFNHAELDITDRFAVERAMQAVRPQVVVHLAALTEVDYCELYPDEAFHTNTLGAWIVAMACQQSGSLMVYLSTDGAYDGKKGEPYTEYDPVNPLSVYSKSKIAGEMHVRNLLRNHYILRAGWMFGGGERDHKFVGKIVERACRQSELMAVADKVGSPIYTQDLAQTIRKLLDISLFGTYHVSNHGFCSRYEFAVEIVKQLGLPCTVKPVSSDYFPSPAPRPPMTVLRNHNLELAGLDDLRPWQAALEDYLSLPVWHSFYKLPGVTLKTSHPPSLSEPSRLSRD